MSVVEVAATVATGLATIAAFGSWFTACKTYKFGELAVLKKRELIVLTQLIERHSLYQATKSRDIGSIDDENFMSFFRQMTEDDHSIEQMVNELRILDNTTSNYLNEFDWLKIGSDTERKIKALQDAQKSLL